MGGGYWVQILYPLSTLVGVYYMRTLSPTRTLSARLAGIGRNKRGPKEVRGEAERPYKYV